MESVTQDTVQRLCEESPRFRMLYEEHQLLDKELVKLSAKPFLSPEQQIDKKKAQKVKLAGRDEMQRILSSLPA